MHTLWVREHNRQAERILERNPDLDGDAVYERARRLDLISKRSLKSIKTTQQIIESFER